MPNNDGLITEIVERFCPRYVPDSKLIYVKGAEQVDQEAANAYFARLGVILPEHVTMPAVIVHDTKKNWLVLIEAGDDHGPINVERQEELKRIFRVSSAPLIFVAAFSSRNAMREHFSAIPWETEVWIAEEPTHLVQLNGQRLLGPYTA